MSTALKLVSPEVRIPKWFNEDEIINPEEPDKSQHKRLRSEFENAPKVVCLPDAAFFIEYQKQRLVVYLEQDRDTFFFDRVAARKSPGYRNLLTQQRHRAHFPETSFNFFYVLVITPTQKRADLLRRAFAKKNKDHDVMKAYRFGSVDMLNEKNLFFEPVFSCCHHDDLVPLMKRME